MFADPLFFLLLLCINIYLCTKSFNIHRDEDRKFPEVESDSLGMVDNELYRSRYGVFLSLFNHLLLVWLPNMYTCRTSVYPVSSTQVKHIPTHDTKNVSCSFSHGSGNSVATMSTEAIYQNCNRYENKSTGRVSLK